jgi:peptidoglycan biosynthesis protein MviN/MurJ (putative lipid II flippase)
MMDPSSTASGSTGSRIVRASVLIGVAHLIFKILGIPQWMAMTRLMEPGTLEIVYIVAFESCIFSLFLIGEEVIGPAFLPIFMKELSDGGENSAWRFANAMLTIQLIVLGLVVSVLYLLPGPIIELVTAWDDSRGADRFALAKRSLSLLAPALICFSVGSTTYMILNGYKRFFCAALGDAAWKLCVLIFVAVGIGIFGFGTTSMIAGIVIGSMAKLLTHIVGMPDKISNFRISTHWNNPALRAMFLLMLPLIGGIVFARVRDVFTNVWVLSHIDTEGLMTANAVGRKLVESIVWLVPYTISIAIFPYFCDLAARNDSEQFGRLLSSSVRMLLSVFIPLAFVCATMAQPVTTLLFLSDKFDMTMVAWASASMACYVFVLPGQAIEQLLIQAFFAKRRMVAIVVLGVLFSSMSMGICYVGIVLYGARGATALAVIALSVVARRILKATAMIIVLRKNVPCFPPMQTLSFLLRTTLTGAGAALLSYVLMALFEGHVSSSDVRLILLLKLAVGGVGALVAFLILIRVMHVAEPSEMLHWCLDRIRKKRSGA